jgi:uncharacterized protein GlcG (DUF336 family)
MRHYQAHVVRAHPRHRHTFMLAAVDAPNVIAFYVRQGYHVASPAERTQARVQAVAAQANDVQAMIKIVYDYNVAVVDLTGDDAPAGPWVPMDYTEDDVEVLNAGPGVESLAFTWTPVEKHPDGSVKRRAWRPLISLTDAAAPDPYKTRRGTRGVATGTQTPTANAMASSSSRSLWASVHEGADRWRRPSEAPYSYCDRANGGGGGGVDDADAGCGDDCMGDCCADKPTRGLFSGITAAGRDCCDAAMASACCADGSCPSCAAATIDTGSPFARSRARQRALQRRQVTGVSGDKKKAVIMVGFGALVITESEVTPKLPRESVKAIVEAACASAKQHNAAVYVVLCNEHGHEVARCGDEGDVFPLARALALGKAYTAWGFSSRRQAHSSASVGARVRDNTFMDLPDFLPVVPLPGGYPLYSAEGDVIGAIGVAGGEGLSDAHIASKAAVDRAAPPDIRARDF